MEIGGMKCRLQNQTMKLPFSASSYVNKNQINTLKQMDKKTIIEDDISKLSSLKSTFHSAYFHDMCLIIVGTVGGFFL